MHIHLWGRADSWYEPRESALVRTWGGESVDYLSEPDIVIGVSLGALPLKQKFVQFVPTSARAVLMRSK